MKKNLWSPASLLLMFVLVGPAWAQWPLGGKAPASVKSTPGRHVTATGRFQIFVSPNLKGHTFMLDTDTGRVWIVKKDHSSGDYSLKRIPVDEIDEKIEKTHKASEKTRDDKKPTDSK